MTTEQQTHDNSTARAATVTRGSETRGRWRRWGALTGIVLAATLGISAGVANADSLQIAVQSSNPEQGIPVNLSFGGTAGAIDSSGDGPFLNAVVRPAGGVPCQSTYENDQAAAGGASTNLFGTFNWPEVGPGSFQVPDTYNPPNTGAYVICAWLENNANLATVGPIATAFGARGPQVSELSVALASPARPDVGFQINYTTQTDQQLSLYSIVKPAGGLPCASSFELDQQQNQSENDVFQDSTSVFGGPVTTSGTDTETSGGSYLICSWIEGPNGGEVDAATTTGLYVGIPPQPVRKAYRVRRCTRPRVRRHHHWVRIRRCRTITIYR
jgi:hypothetical protein